MNPNEPPDPPQSRDRTQSMDKHITEQMKTAVDRRRERESRKNKRQMWLSSRSAQVENDLKNISSPRQIENTQMRNSNSPRFSSASPRNATSRLLSSSSSQTFLPSSPFLSQSIARVTPIAASTSSSASTSTTSSIFSLHTSVTWPTATKPSLSTSSFTSSLSDESQDAQIDTPHLPVPRDTPHAQACSGHSNPTHPELTRSQKGEQRDAFSTLTGSFLNANSEGVSFSFENLDWLSNVRTSALFDSFVGKEKDNLPPPNAEKHLSSGTKDFKDAQQFGSSSGSNQTEGNHSSAFAILATPQKQDPRPVNNERPTNNTWEGWDESKTSGLEHHQPYPIVKKKKIGQSPMSVREVNVPIQSTGPPRKACQFAIGDISRYFLESEVRVFKWIELKLDTSTLVDHLDLHLSQESSYMKGGRELPNKLASKLSFIYSSAALGCHLKTGDVARTSQIWERSCIHFTNSTMNPTKTKILTLIVRIMFLLAQGNLADSLDLTLGIADIFQRRKKLEKKPLEKKLIDTCHLIMYMSTVNDWQKMAMMKLLNQDLSCATNTLPSTDLTFFGLVNDHILTDVCKNPHLVSVPKFLLVYMMLADMVDMASAQMLGSATFFSLMSILESVHIHGTGPQINSMLRIVLLSVKGKINNKIGKYEEAMVNAKDAVKLGNYLLHNYMDNIWVRISVCNCLKVLTDLQMHTEIKSAVDILSSLKKLGYQWPFSHL